MYNSVPVYLSIDICIHIHAHSILLQLLQHRRNTKASDSSACDSVPAMFTPALHNNRPILLVSSSSSPVITRSYESLSLECSDGRTMHPVGKHRLHPNSKWPDLKVRWICERIMYFLPEWANDHEVGIPWSPQRWENLTDSTVLLTLADVL